MKIFGMITTSASARYTAAALDSFFRVTPLSPQDRFLLIDNDGTWSGELPPIVELRRNSKPRGFAANMNQIINEALRSSADAYLLNNDLIFTRGWINPLLSEQPIILSPFTNREVAYACTVHVATTGSVPDMFVPRCGMPMEDYLGHEGALEAIAEAHRKSGTGLYRVLVAPYCCAKLPLQVMQAVGYFDENYGNGGGEDYDYSLRAQLLGYKTAYALGSYVLHFGGKSSWSGVETEGEQSAREEIFFNYFKEKWGDRLFNFILREQASAVGDLRDLIESADESVVIQTLMGRPATGLQIFELR